MIKCDRIKNIWKLNDGVIYLATVIMMLVLAGLFITVLTKILNSSSLKNGNLYIDSQAEMAAVAGIEYAYYQMINDFANWDGTGTETYVTLGNSKFMVEVRTDDEIGDPLSSDLKRVISTGVTEKSIKKIQVLITVLSEAFTFALYIFELEDPIKNNEIRIPSSSSLKGDLYIGTNVDISIKREYIDNVSVYVPPGYTVFSSPADFDDTYSWDTHPLPLPEFPVFDTTVHDALLAIAAGIIPADTIGVNNKIYGDLTINSDWDLSAYEGNTVFINGDLTVSGNNANINANIPFLPLADPGYIIVNGTVDYKNNCLVGDNIITIASGDVTVLSTGTQYGIDWSPNPVPTRVNEIFSWTNVNLSAGTVFASVESMGDASLKGNVNTAVFCAGTVQVEGAIFKGSLVTRKVKLDKMANCDLEFKLPLAVSATAGLKASIVPGSWKVI